MGTWLWILLNKWFALTMSIYAYHQNLKSPKDPEGHFLRMLLAEYHTDHYNATGNGIHPRSSLDNIIHTILTQSVYITVPSDFNI